MGKNEIIRVRLSAETLAIVRSKTKSTGEGLSGYVRRLIMVDLGGVAIIGDNDLPEVVADMNGVVRELSKKKSNPTDELGWRERLKKK